MWLFQWGSQLLTTPANPSFGHIFCITLEQRTTAGDSGDIEIIAAGLTLTARKWRYG